MKTKIVFASLAMLTAICLARPIKFPSYKELYEKSDLVAILSVERIEISETVSSGNPNPKKYQDYFAHCKIEHALKGHIETNSIIVPFFHDPMGAPGFNGAIVAPFTQNKVLVHYLAYLKKSDDNTWLPSAGTHDAALSIKAMRPILEPKYLELPKAKKEKTSEKPPLGVGK